MSGRPWSVSNIELEYPTRLVFPPSWLGHIPFAFWLVGALRPRTLVELGVHTGNSTAPSCKPCSSCVLTHSASALTIG